MNQLAPACCYFDRGGYSALPSYRLYCLDGAGKITTAEWIEAASDEDARREAHERAHPNICEIWDRSRFVARIEPAGS